MISNDISACPWARGHNKTVINLSRFARKSVFGFYEIKRSAQPQKRARRLKFKFRKKLGIVPSLK